MHPTVVAVAVNGEAHTLAQPQFKQARCGEGLGVDGQLGLVVGQHGARVGFDVEVLDGPLRHTALLKWRSVVVRA